MKSVFVIVVALALAAVSLPFAVAQQDATSQPSAQQQQAPTPDATQPSSSSTTTSTTTTTTQQSTDQSQAVSTGSSQTAPMTGTIAKAGDKWVLQTTSGTYQLDNQDKASQFEGKQVSVTGSVDQSTSMIHVTDIAPAQ